jgi:hypothetical protein
LYQCELVRYYLVDLGNDRQSIHNGGTNHYSIMHDGNKIGLNPVTLKQILKDDLAIACRVQDEDKHKSENWIATKDSLSAKHASKSHSSHPNDICFKILGLLASKTDIFELDVSNTQCYAIICKEVLFSFEDMPPSLPPIVANILHKYVDVFVQEVPLGLSPILQNRA